MQRVCERRERYKQGFNVLLLRRIGGEIENLKKFENLSC